MRYLKLLLHPDIIDLFVCQLITMLIDIGSLGHTEILKFSGPRNHHLSVILGRFMGPEKSKKKGISDNRDFAFGTKESYLFTGLLGRTLRCGHPPILVKCLSPSQ